MYTVKQVAAEIDKLKPNFKEFIELLKDNDNNLESHIFNTSNIFERLFKAQLVAITHTTHNHYYGRGDLSDKLNQFLMENIIDSQISKHQYGYNTHKHIITNSFLDNHIAKYVINVKQYLTPYLRNKVRSKTTTLAEKQLQPNLMSLKAFEAYLKTLKKDIPSTVAIGYFKQLEEASFNELREQFIDAIFTKCTPSIYLQKKLSIYFNDIVTLTTQEDSKLHKYMTLNKCSIRFLAYRLKIPISESVHNDRDSEYKPFITNISRKVDTDMKQVSYLFGALLVLKTSSAIKPNLVYDFFVEQLTEHLSLPEYKTVLNELKTHYTAVSNAFNTLTI